MASPIEVLTLLDEPEHIKTWIISFAALARVKKLKDQKFNGGSERNLRPICGYDNET